MSQKPQIVDGLDINVVEDGYVVYQPQRRKVHFLNHSAAVILELCDGRRSTDEIVSAIKEAYQLSKPPEAEVAQTLKDLDQEGLIRLA